MKLKAKKINGLVEPGLHNDGHGLYLQVKATNHRSWIFRYERNGRQRWMGLGSVHTVSLADARSRAQQARRLLLDGIDPIGERERKAQEKALEDSKRLTFEQAARQYYAEHSVKWRNKKYRAQFLSTLEMYAFEKMGRLSVADIDTGLVLRVLKPIWNDKAPTASRVRGRIEDVLNWATLNGFRKEGENPASWKGRLSGALPAPGQITRVKHHKALPIDDVYDFMGALAKRDSVGSRALEFLVLTAARTGEILGAQWSEIDLEAKLWTVPANRMKAGKAHRVPLSDNAVALLKALPRDAEYVFAGTRKGAPVSGMAMAQLLKRMGYSDITVHGFRSTFSDWAHERTSYPNHVVEMALAHAIGNKVEAAYRRGDLLAQRTRLMADWAAFCSTPKRDATVTPIRGRA